MVGSSEDQERLGEEQFGVDMFGKGDQETCLGLVKFEMPTCLLTE